MFYEYRVALKSNLSKWEIGINIWRFLSQCWDRILSNYSSMVKILLSLFNHYNIFYLTLIVYVIV